MTLKITQKQIKTIIYLPISNHKKKNRLRSMNNDGKWNHFSVLSGSGTLLLRPVSVASVKPKTSQSLSTMSVSRGARVRVTVRSTRSRRHRPSGRLTYCHLIIMIRTRQKEITSRNSYIYKEFRQKFTATSTTTKMFGNSMNDLAGIRCRK